MLRSSSPRCFSRSSALKAATSLPRWASARKRANSAAGFFGNAFQKQNAVGRGTGEFRNPIEEVAIGFEQTELVREKPWCEPAEDRPPRELIVGVHGVRIAQTSDFHHRARLIHELLRW